MSTRRSEKRSLRPLVGDPTYAVWVDMLRRLVPDGRTHRLSQIVAGMLEFASVVAEEKFGERPVKGSSAQSLILASELADPDEIIGELSDLVEKLFEDAEDLDQIFVVSLTHLRVKPDHPLRGKIATYQKRRVTLPMPKGRGFSLQRRNLQCRGSRLHDPWCPTGEL